MKNTKSNALERYGFPIFYTVILVLSTAFLTIDGGILRTLPLVLFMPAVATLFFNKKLLTIAFCFLSTLCFCTIQTTELAASLKISLIAAAFSSLGILAKRFFVTYRHNANEKKGIFCLFAFAALLLVGIICYALLFGNPFSYLGKQSQNTAYINNTHADEVEIKSTYYDFARGEYFTRVAFTDDTRMTADICASGEKIYDGYSNYYEYKMLSQRRNELSRLLDDHFGNNQFALRINQEQTLLTVGKAQLDELDSYYSQMVFDLAFYNQLDNPEIFAESCKACAEFIFENGFELKSINFYGGFADNFKFEMNVPFGFSQDFSALVADFSAGQFDRFYEESDYIDGWRYGS